MNLDKRNYYKYINNKGKINNFDKFVNKTKGKLESKEVKEKGTFQIKSNYYNKFYNSYTYNYNKRNFNNNRNLKYVSKTYDNKKKYISIKNNKKNFLKLDNCLNDKNNNNKPSLFNLKKFFTKNKQMTFKPNSTYTNRNKILLKPPFDRGIFSYKKTININQKNPKIKNYNFAQRFINVNKIKINKNNFNEYNDNYNFQISNISNIKQKLNSSIHHMNSSSSLNTIDNVLNNDENINNKNNIRNLILKNKIYKDKNYCDEEQENKNINVNKSTKSTKSRSIDLNKYLIKSLNDYNIKNNYKKNSISSINKKNNQNEINSFEEPFSIQESIQLYKFKSNEFDDFENYKNINNEYININNINNNKIENKNEINLWNKNNRRLIVEYLKILKKKYKNFSIEELCKINNIDQKILNPGRKKNLKENIINLDKKKDLKQKINLDFSKNENNPNIYKNNEKINYLNSLSTPRIMFLINESNEKIPYIFFLAPNISTYDNGIERYSFKWNNINNVSDNNSYDLFHLKKCKINNKNYKRFDITFKEHDYIEENENFSSTFIIDALSYELANYYVNGFNFLLKENNFLYK